MKRCNNCGYIGEEGNFCPTCGTPLAEAGEQQVEYQPSAEQPYYQPSVQQAPQEEMTLGNWLVTLLLTCIPCVNLIMLFVWGFGGNAPRSKANWAKAQLIFMAIGVVFVLIWAAVMGAAFGSIFYNYY